MDEAVEEGAVGLGLDRHPFGRDRAGDRQVRFDLDALGAAGAGIGLAPDADDTRRRFGVGAAVDDEVSYNFV